MIVGSLEYQRELDYVRSHGQDSAAPSVRSADQTAQALFYRQDTEIFIYEAARIASAARHLTLDEDAKLFAAEQRPRRRAHRDLCVEVRAEVLAPDHRDQRQPRRVDQQRLRRLASARGDAVAPREHLGPRHQRRAASEILRAFFGDAVLPDGGSDADDVALAGRHQQRHGKRHDARAVDLQPVAARMRREPGLSGVHWGFDVLQGNLAGLAVADRILRSGDPAAAGVRARPSHVSLRRITRTLASRPDLYGLFSSPRAIHRQ